MPGIAAAVAHCLVTPHYFSFIAGVNFDLIYKHCDLLKSVASI